MGILENLLQSEEFNNFMSEHRHCPEELVPKKVENVKKFIIRTTQSIEEINMMDRIRMDEIIAELKHQLVDEKRVVKEIYQSLSDSIHIDKNSFILSFIKDKVEEKKLSKLKRIGIYISMIGLLIWSSNKISKSKKDNLKGLK